MKMDMVSFTIVILAVALQLSWVAASAHSEAVGLKGSVFVATATGKEESTSTSTTTSATSQTPRLLQDDGADDGGIDIGEIIGFSCFSAVATVQVQGRGAVAMSDLQVGDTILTTQGYQPLYAFGHVQRQVKGEFWQIHTSQKGKQNQPLEMTGEHLVFLQDKAVPVRADSIQVGDQLQGVNGPAQVTRLIKVVRTGLYAPFTASGTLIVDGIVASSYISLDDNSNHLFALPMISAHQFMHWGAAPLRLLCLGVNGHLCHSNDDAGYVLRGSYGVHLLEAVSKQALWMQRLFFAVSMVLLGLCVLAEQIFLGPTWAPTLMVVTTTLYWIWRKQQQEQQQQEQSTNNTFGKAKAL